jgi:hypothetical protein
LEAGRSSCRLEHTFHEVVSLKCKVVPHPTGTRGQDDLRHRARRESLGEGRRVEVASAGDLVRMLEAHGATDPITMETMCRVVELDRGLEIER